MIRPFTLITAMLAMLSGAYMFAVKHRAQMLDDQLSAVSEQTRLDQQRIRVLQAQWSLEIDPTRLSQLAHQFTVLQPMQPAQLTTLVSLASALPAPGSLAPAANPMAPLPDMTPLASVTPAGAQVQMASAEPPAVTAPVHQAPHVLHAASRPPRHQPDHSQIAEDQIAENLTAPRPIHPRSTYPMGAQVMSVRATDNPSAADNGSALAMGADMAPPQPLQDGANN